MISIIIKQKDKIVKVLLFLFILSLFFPIRHVFFTKEAYLIGVYSDFTSFSLYLSDILLLGLFVVLLISRGRNLYHVIKRFRWLTVVLILGLLVNRAHLILSAYLSLKFLELIVAYGTLRLVFEENALKKGFLTLFAWLCGLESIIALIQFARQSPIGLFRIGEEHIGARVLGVAKIVSDGTTYIRAYGTFPHPNLLSAFLVTGILITTYLLINSKTLKSKISYSILLFLNILGLTVTFSRGAYLALGVGLIIYFEFLLWGHRKTEFKGPLHSPPVGGSARLAEAPAKRVGMTVVIILISILVSFFVFKPFLLTRATFSDQSTMDRKFYDVTGLKMIEKNPIFGIGAGESVLMMEKYSGKSLQPWEKQPPHNYFIIAAAELGLPAMILLIWIFFFHLWKLFTKIKSGNGPGLPATHYLLLTILICFLLLMQFDHYFYTLEQTQLLLWLMLALAAEEIKNPQYGDL